MRRRVLSPLLVFACGCGPGQVADWPSFGDDDLIAEASESSTSESSTSESSTSESSTSESESGCMPGSEGCSCDGGSCFDGLTCAEGTCHAGQLVCGSSIVLRDTRIASCPTKPWVQDDTFGNDHDLRAEAFVYSGSLYYGRIMLEFDLESIPAGPLALASIVLSPYDETPTFFHVHDGSPTNAAWLMPITAPWSEGEADWEETPAFGEPYLALPAIDVPNTGIAIDITAIVIDMRETNDFGHGFAIQLQDETPDTRLAFASDEALDEQQRPRLEYCVVVQ